MIFSTIALIVGFGVLITSEFVPTIYFGSLMSLAMLGGMLGNLIVLPLLLLWTEKSDAALQASKSKFFGSFGKFGLGWPFRLRLHGQGGGGDIIADDLELEIVNPQLSLARQHHAKADVSRLLGNVEHNFIFLPIAGALDRSGAHVVERNGRFLQAIDAHPQARRALDVFNLDERRSCGHVCRGSRRPRRPASDCRTRGSSLIGFRRALCLPPCFWSVSRVSS